MQWPFPVLCPPGGVFVWYSHPSRGVQLFVGTWFIPESRWESEKEWIVSKLFIYSGGKKKKRKKERASLSSFWIFRHLMYTWRYHALKQAFNMWLIPVRIIFLPLLSEALSWAEKESDSCVNKIFKIIPKSVCFSSNLHHQLLPAPKCLFSLLQVHKWEDWNQHQLWMGFQYCSGEEVGESSVN